MLRRTTSGGLVLCALVALGCSDPDVPPPAGAASLSLFAAPGTPAHSRCALSEHEVAIGSALSSARRSSIRPVSTGGDTSVECRVSGSGSFQALLRQGSVAFQLEGTASSGEATGSLSLSSFDPVSARLQSPADVPCTVTPLDVAAGEIWATYECPLYQDPDRTRETYCAASGVVFLEHCPE
jgi:hypothetical protein